MDPIESRKRVQQHALRAAQTLEPLSLDPPARFPPPASTPRHSLRHINLRVSKTWLAGALWAALVVVGGWVATSIPYVWSWEKHQITDAQLGRVLYESSAIVPRTGKPEAAPSFDEQLLPNDGLYVRIDALEEQLKAASAVRDKQAAELAGLRDLLVDEYRWRVRWQAADTERDPRKRADSANRAEAKFKRAVAEGKPVPEAFRYALEQNPYDVR